MRLMNMINQIFIASVIQFVLDIMTMVMLLIMMMVRFIMSVFDNCHHHHHDHEYPSHEDDDDDHYHDHDNNDDHLSVASTVTIASDISPSSTWPAYSSC